MAASLSVYFKMVDQMSGKLGEVANSGDRLADSLGDIEASANRAFGNMDNLTDDFNTSMSRVSGTAGDFGDAMEEAGEETEDFGQSVQNSGQNIMTLSDIIAAAGIAKMITETTEAFKECVDATNDYEDALAKVSTIADTSVKSMEAYKSEILALSNDTGQAATDLSEAAYSALSASVATEKSIDFVEKANALAVGGFTSTANAVDVLTTAINAYNLSADETEKISSTLIMTQNLGKTTVDELGASMGRVIPTAAAFGVNLDNLAATYAIMTANGIQTAQATTYMSGMLSELNKSGTDVANTIEDMTGKSFKELMEAGLSLGDVIGILGEAVDGDSVALANLFGSIEAGKGALTIFNSDVEHFNEVLGEMENSSGAAAAAYEKMTNTASFAEKKMNNSIENLRIAVGDSLAPTFVELETTVTGVVNRFTEFVQENPEVVRAFMSTVEAMSIFTAAVTAYNVAAKAATIAQAAFNLVLDANPVFLAVSAIGALTVGIATYMTTLDGASDVTDEYTRQTKNLQEEIERQEQIVAGCERRFGEYNQQTLEAKARLEDLQEEFSKTAITVGELESKLTASRDTIRSHAEAFTTDMTAIKQDADAAMILAGRLETLERAAAAGNVQSEAEAAIVDALTKKYSDLDITYDKIAGKLSKSTDEIKKYVLAQREQAEAQAQAQRYTDALVDQDKAWQDLTAANEAYRAAQEELNQKQAEYNAMIEEGNSPGFRPDWSAEEAEVAALKEQLDAARAVYHELDEEVRNYTGDIEAKTKADQDAFNALSAHEQGVQAFGDAMAKLTEQDEDYIKNVEETYEKAYNSALSSINGQLGLWGTLKAEQKITVDEMMKAWDEQIAYMDKYNENMDKLREAGISENILRSLGSGSAESAGNLQTLVDKLEEVSEATEEPEKAINEFVDNFNAKFEEAQIGKETLATTMAEMNADVEEKFGEIGATVEAGIAEMNLSDDAAQAARDTLQGYIDGLEAQNTVISTKLASIREAAQAALMGGHNGMPSSVVGSVFPQYATGTTNAFSTFIAGEDGPELILNGAGSTVFPTSETDRIIAAITNRDDLSVRPSEEMVVTRAQKKDININLGGKGSISVSGSISRDQVEGYVRDMIEPTLIGMVIQEMQEEGASYYEY